MRVSFRSGEVEIYRAQAQLIAASRRAARLPGRGAGDADPPRADEIEDPVRVAELVERVELLRRAGELEHDRVGADVEQAPAEGLGGGDELGALLGRRRDPDDEQLPLDGLARRRARSPGAR